jgi:hypothetical protein
MAEVAAPPLHFPRLPAVGGARVVAFCAHCLHAPKARTPVNRCGYATGDKTSSVPCTDAPRLSPGA